MGRRISGPGVCRWCRCDHFHPCPVGCAWTNARTQQLCTACVAVDEAWRRLRLSRLPNMHRAFFRGFMAGTDDERAVDVGLMNGRGERAVGANPYRGRTAAYWQAGVEAAVR